MLDKVDLESNELGRGFKSQAVINYCADHGRGCGCAAENTFLHIRCDRCNNKYAFQ